MTWLWNGVYMMARVPALTGARVPAVMRTVLLLLCLGVAASATDPVPGILWAAPVAVVAALSSLPKHSRRWSLLAAATEGLVTGLAIGTTGFDNSPFLPYLIAPAFGAGLTAGLPGGVLALGTAAAALLASPVLADESLTPGHASTASQWVVLSLLVAAVASWIRAVLAEADERRDTHAAQVEALRLLTQLRDVARELPGTLDPTTSAEAMLGRARILHRFDHGSVLVAVAGSQQLTVVARIGTERPQWNLSLSGRSLLSTVWHSQTALVLGHRLPRSGRDQLSGSALVIPLLSADRTVALIVLESGVAQAFTNQAATDVADAVSDLTLQLQTGLVFDEVRELATHEERRRLAREIHDGIAQELASLAYSLDTVAADTVGHPVAPQVDTIRDEVRRLVTELRMSLFDLRSDVDPDEGLGAAIGRHVRAVGTASGMTVHLSLNEGPVRLAAETEAELLRIVQEAVANARKHSRASNLWVTCTVEPPGALVSVEDDGLGVPGDIGVGSHGLAIMRERAARIRADIVVEPRSPTGTRVALTLGKVPT
jgi:signal transduction histidine kinase